MEAIAYVLSPEVNKIGGKELIALDGIRDDFRIIIEVNDNKIELRRSKEFFKLEPINYEGSRIDDISMISYLRELLEKSGLHTEKIAWIDTSTLYISNIGEYNFERSDMNSPIPLVKEIIENVEEIAYELLSISRIFTEAGKIYVKKRNEWILFNQLAYGERKALTIITAINLADVIFLEAFEAGLHADLIVDLIDYLTKSDKIVVIETHLGLIVTQGVSKGWTAYYIEDGRTIKEISKLAQLRDVNLYRREIEAIRF